MLVGVLQQFVTGVANESHIVVFFFYQIVSEVEQKSFYRTSKCCNKTNFLSHILGRLG